MITGRDHLLTWFTDNGLIYWEIKASEKGNTISTVGEAENLTHDEGKSRLERALNVLNPGNTYYIVGSQISFKSQDRKKRLESPFRMKEGEGMAGIGNPMAGPQFQHSVDVQGEIRKAIEEYKSQEEIKRLKEENAKLVQDLKEAQDSSNSPLERVIGRLEPFINGFILKKFPAKQAGAIANVNGTISQDEYTDRLEKAFEKWNQAEPSELTQLILVEKIADLSITDPQTYAMAKGILLK